MLRFYSVKIISLERLPEKYITVSSDIMQKVQVKTGSQINLQFGNKSATVRVKGCHGNAAGTSVFLSRQIQELLLLPVPITLNMVSGPSPDIFRLGPVIGIFANRTHNPARPFGEQTGYFCKLKAAARNLNALCYAFSPANINWNSGIIQGAIPPLPGSGSEWKTLFLPFPDVIYDRGLFPAGEKRMAATETRKILRNYAGLKLFNPAFFGKWKTHKLLSKHELLQEHLPETKLFHSGSEVFDLLERHHSVYIKPSGGSSGRGIIRVTTCPEGYNVDYRMAKQVKTINFTDKTSLAKYLTERVGSKRYIVQQGLKLVELNGCSMDIRVLMQKDQHGFWQRTGTAARIAGQGNYISNIHAGGKATKISTALTMIFQDLNKIQRIQKDISRLSSLIAAWVSTESHHLFGEIAVDLGIDDTGKVWIIELNAVPGRTVFRRIGAMKIAAKAIARPMEYAFYLSGFAPQHNK